MKTLSELQQAEALAEIKESRASMRYHALNYRQSIHPESFSPWSNYHHRIEIGAHYLEMAISNRNRNLRQQARALEKAA